jgi:hypothetical protein
MITTFGIKGRWPQRALRRIVKGIILNEYNQIFDSVIKTSKPGLYKYLSCVILTYKHTTHALSPKG